MNQIFKYKNSILNEILKNSVHYSKETLIVFDLDSTLFDVTPRVQQIVDEFNQNPDHEKAFPEDLQKFRNARMLPTDWGFEKALHRVGLHAPSEDFFRALHTYWEKLFFTDSYLHFDAPYEGAVQFVKDVLSQGAQVAYLTGRDVERMGKGSKEVLLKWDFPVHATATLELKPEREMDDAQFKSDWFKTATKSFKKIYFIDNEPKNIYLVIENHPQVEIVYFDSTHSGHSPPPLHLPTIKDYL